MSLLSRLHPRQINKLADALQPVRFKAGDTVITQGTTTPPQAVGRVCACDAQCASLTDIGVCWCPSGAPLWRGCGVAAVVATGETGDVFYLVKSGTVIVSQLIEEEALRTPAGMTSENGDSSGPAAPAVVGSLSNEELVIMELGEGEHFGEVRGVVCVCWRLLACMRACSVGVGSRHTGTVASPEALHTHHECSAPC